MLPDPPTLITTALLVGRFLEYSSGSFPGFDLPRDKFAGNYRAFARQLDVTHLEWWDQLWSTYQRPRLI